MKKSIKRVVTCILMSLLLVSMVALVPVDANAATKSKKKQTKEAPDETLVALTTYLDTLVAMNASAEDILAAQQAVAQRQYQLAQQALLAQQMAELAKSQDEALKAAAKSLELSAGVIFVGDSRTVQMKDSVGLSAASFIAENSKGYTWFKDVALNQLDPMVKPGVKIVINLGVNDPGNIDNYIALVNQKTFEWTAKGATVYYATVNPVSENPYTSQTQVDYFNSKLVPGLVGVNIIDTNSFLKLNGYTLVDGLHYTEKTYKDIYNYILSRL